MVNQTSTLDALTAYLNNIGNTNPINNTGTAYSNTGYNTNGGVFDVGQALGIQGQPNLAYSPTNAPTASGLDYGSTSPSNFWGEGGAAGGISAGIGALTGLVNMGIGIKNSKRAGEIFDFQKNAYKQDLANQLASYNTRINDRNISRQSAMGEGSFRSAYGTDVAGKTAQDSLKKL